MSLPTIKASSEISEIFSKGSRVANRYITFIFLRKDNHTEHGLNGRVAFIAGKRLGNAVWRNSAKRRMREIYISENNLLKGIDILFVAKPALMEDSYSKVLNTCQKTLGKIEKQNIRN